jgi:hypothetical protein
MEFTDYINDKIFKICFDCVLRLFQYEGVILISAIRGVSKKSIKKFTVSGKINLN